MEMILIFFLLHDTQNAMIQQEIQKNTQEYRAKEKDLSSSLYPSRISYFGASLGRK